MKISLTPVAAAGIIAAATFIDAAPVRFAPLSGMTNAAMQRRAQLDHTPAPMDLERRTSAPADKVELAARTPVTLEELMKTTEGPFLRQADIGPGEKELDEFDLEPLHIQNTYRTKAKNTLINHFSNLNEKLRAEGKEPVEIPLDSNAKVRPYEHGDLTLHQHHRLNDRNYSVVRPDRMNVEDIARAWYAGHRFSTVENGELRWHDHAAARRPY